MKTFKELLTKMKDCKKAMEKQQIMDAFEDYWKNVKDAEVLAKEIKTLKNQGNTITKHSEIRNE